MPQLINLPRAPWRQQPPAGTDLADPWRWSTAACLNTPISNSSGVNGIGWSTGGAPGAAFLSGADPSEMTQNDDGVVIKNIADYLTGAEIKIAGITNNSEVVGSFVFAFKGATVLNYSIALVADGRRNYVRYDGVTIRALFNNRATDFTIPSLLDGRDHVLAIRLSKSTYLNRAIFLDGRMIGAQDQADTAVYGWDSTDSSFPPRIFGWQGYYNRDWNATNQFFAYTTDYLSDSELIAYTENPWQLFNPRPARFILIPSSGGIYITPAALSHTSELEQPVATQDHLLVANGLGHNQSLGGSSLVQHNSLAPSHLQHTSTLSEPSIVQANSIIAAGLMHQQNLNTAVLVQASVIAPTEILHTQTLEGATIQVAGALIPDGLAHQQNINQPAVVQTHVITPGGLEHSHELTLTQLSQSTILLADNLIHFHPVESAALSIGLSITPDGLIQVQTLENSSLAQANIIFSNSLSHLQTVSVAQLLSGKLHAPRGRTIGVGPSDRCIVVGASDRYIVITPHNRAIIIG